MATISETRKYRITVETIDATLNTIERTIILCETRYLLGEDLPEWVREEIDAEAVIITGPETPAPE